MAAHGFSRDGARRIVRAVRRVEGQPARSGDRTAGSVPATPEFWIELTGEDPDNPGLYSWKKVVPQEGELVDTDPLIDSGTDDEDSPLYTARELNGTQGLAPGTKYEVKFVGYDGADPPHPRFLFPNGGAPGGFWAKLAGATPITGQANRWSYAWVEQIVNKTGTFTDRPAGQTSADAGVAAYNSMEANNSAAGVQGNGVNVTNLPAGWAIQPIAAGAVVWARAETNCDGDQELYFQAPNGTDGGCA